MLKACVQGALEAPRVWGLGFRVLGFRVWGLGFRVLGFRVLGFRVWGFWFLDKFSGFHGLGIMMRWRLWCLWVSLLWGSGLT